MNLIVGAKIAINLISIKTKKTATQAFARVADFCYRSAAKVMHLFIIGFQITQQCLEIHLRQRPRDCGVHLPVVVQS